MTEQEWLASEDFFHSKAGPALMSNMKETRRTSILLAAHAISRTIHLVEDRVDRERVQEAASFAFSLAEQEDDASLNLRYINEFQYLLQRGEGYGRFMDEVELGQEMGHATVTGEILVGLLQLSQIIRPL